MVKIGKATKKLLKASNFIFLDKNLKTGFHILKKRNRKTVQIFSKFYPFKSEICKLTIYCIVMVVGLFEREKFVD